MADRSVRPTETPCAAGKDGLECRIAVEQALLTLPANIAGKLTNASEAALPTTFVMPNGETRRGHLGGGIDTGRVVVVDLSDGTRRVVGLVCYLPYPGDGSGLAVSLVSCTTSPLDDWRDGNAPPSYPPGTEFG